LRGEGIEVAQQLTGRRHQLRNLGRGIATQHGAHGTGGQRWVGQDAAVRADVGAPHHAAHQREHAGLAQPVRVFLGHIHHDAGVAGFGQFNAAHAADGKAENVMSMPTTTPSESSAVSTRVCVGSNAPRIQQVQARPRSTPA
jgi:hypothetical protein